MRETGLEIVVVKFSPLLHAPRSFNINAFTFLNTPRFSHPIPNGEGFLRDFGNAKLLRFVPCNLLLTYSFLFEFLC